MGQIFGKEKPLKEVMRENKRMITRAVRELDREKLALEREEKRLTIEIKKAAKEGQMSSVKIMAKVCKLCCGWRASFVQQHHGTTSSVILNRATTTHICGPFFGMNSPSLFRTWFGLDSTLPSLLKCAVIYKGAPSSSKLLNRIMPWRKR